MSLWKRGKIYWAYVWIDGVRYMKTTNTGNRHMAQMIEARFKDELNLKVRHQMTDLDPSMTFGELATRFVASTTPKAHHINSLKNLLPFFADMQLSRISKSQAAEFRRRRHEQKKLTETTVNRDLEVLRHILFWAVDEQLILANPLARMRMERERRRKRPVMSVHEEEALLKVASPHLKRIIICALDTGMRRGEILNQKWEDVDFYRRVLFVTKSKTAEGESREIPFTNRFYLLLWESKQDQGLIFTFKEQHINRVKTTWRTAQKYAGLKTHYRFHDLRHTFNSRLAYAGVIQDVRKALMGHSSGEEINSIYTHIELPSKQEAIAKLEQWVSNQKQNPIPVLFQGGTNASQV